MCFSIIGIYAEKSSMEVAGVQVESSQSSQVSFYAACFHMQGGNSFLSDPPDPQRCGRYPSPDSLILFLAPVSRRMFHWLMQALMLPLLLLPLGHTAPKDGAAR